MRGADGRPVPRWLVCQSRAHRTACKALLASLSPTCWLAPHAGWAKARAPTAGKSPSSTCLTSECECSPVQACARYVLSAAHCGSGTFACCSFRYAQLPPTPRFEQQATRLQGLMSFRHATVCPPCRTAAEGKGLSKAGSNASLLATASTGAESAEPGTRGGSDDGGGTPTASSSAAAASDAQARTPTASTAQPSTASASPAPSQAQVRPG